MSRRPSAARRTGLGALVVLGVVAWLGAVVIWTAAGRVSSSGGFADVAIETIQSPPGSAAVADAVVAEAVRFAQGKAVALTVAGEDVIREQVGAVVADPGLSGLIGSALERAHRGFIDRPGDDITIDLSAIRVPLARALGTLDPSLVEALPPAEALSVTVRPADLDPSVTDVADGVNILQMLPLGLLIVAVVFLGGAFLATDDRARTARRVGIAFILIGVLPLVLRLVAPWIAGIAGGAGNTGDIARVAAVAIVGNWWVALSVTVLVGAAMLGLGVVLRGPRRSPGAPAMLGG